MSLSLKFVCLLLAALLLPIVGCGRTQESLKLVGVNGIVTLDGKPLANAKVQFFPELPVDAPTSTKQEESLGITDATGKYAMQGVHGEKGAMIGKNKVVISKLMTPDGKDLSPTEDQATLAGVAKQALPETYSDPAKTILTADVSSKGGAINFELKSAP